MNLIKTYIDKSPIEGMGLYAGEDIPKGTKIWVLGGLDQIFSDQELSNLHLSELQDKYAKRYIYRYKGASFWIYCGDDAKYTNHSLDPNTEVYMTTQYAIKDIKIGDEITCNYYTLDPNFTEEEFNDN